MQVEDGSSAAVDAGATAGEGGRSLAVVTGASSGIGKALAPLILADGYDLLLVARRQDRLEALKARYGPDRTSTLALDLATPAGQDRLGEHLASLGRPVDVLVNNAGFGAMGPVAKADPGEITGMVDLNVRALVALTRQVLPGMGQRERGGILNVASTAAFQPGPGMATYYATKAFVLSFTEAVAAEVGGRNVRVTALCPGPTITEFQVRARMERSALFRVMPTMGADEVARIGWRGFCSGRRVVVAGPFNKASAALAPLVPRAVLLPLVKRLNRP